MQETTRSILADEMVRTWHHCRFYKDGDPPPFTGTPSQAVEDLCRRLGLVAHSHRLVQDDGDWTVRVTWDNGSVSTEFCE